MIPLMLFFIVSLLTKEKMEEKLFIFSDPCKSIFDFLKIFSVVDTQDKNDYMPMRGGNELLTDNNNGYDSGYNNGSGYNGGYQ